MLPSPTLSIDLTPTEPPTVMPTTTPRPTATPGEADIVFVLRDRYRAGEALEVKIFNRSESNRYYYQAQYPACYNLKFFDSTSESRPYPEVTAVAGTRPPRMLLPGQFVVPEGTHCDLIWEKELAPGGEAVLFTWDLDRCVKDRWGCIGSAMLSPGEYRIEGEFTQTPWGSLDLVEPVVAA